MTPVTYEASSTPTLQLESKGARYAYRRFGKQRGRPLVFLQRFRGTMDDWDPALLEPISKHRPIILFDAPGIGRSDGKTASTVAGMASQAAGFIKALDAGRVDVLGFSLGGIVTQQLALDHPDLIDSIIVAGAGSGYLADAPPVDEKVKQVRDRPVYADEDLLYLFFHDSPSSQAAGVAHLARLRQRADAFAKLVVPESIAAQTSAIMAVGQPEGSLVPLLSRVSKRALIANGFHDRMQPAYRSYVAATRIPDAKLVLYPDAGHGFLFQYHEEFSREVLTFLAK